MSAKLTGAVWELELPRPQKFVLLCLADHAKDDGSDVYPSIARIQYKTGYSETQVRDLMQALVRSHILVIVNKGGKGRGDTAEYQINIAAASAKRPFREWLISTQEAELPAKGSKTVPLAKGAESADLGCGNTPVKGPKTAPESKSNHHSRTKPSDEASDPRHGVVREFIQAEHAKTLQLARNQVPWDSRAGGALSKWLADNPHADVELITALVACHYASPARLGMLFPAWIAKLWEYQSGPVNQWGTPLRADYVFQRQLEQRSEASVGRR